MLRTHSASCLQAWESWFIPELVTWAANTHRKNRCILKYLSFGYFTLEKYSEMDVSQVELRSIKNDHFRCTQNGPAPRTLELGVWLTLLQRRILIDPADVLIMTPIDYRPTTIRSEGACFDTSPSFDFLKHVYLVFSAIVYQRRGR